MITTRENVVKYHKRNPCLSLVAIGNKFGITRERVRVILKTSGLPTKRLMGYCKGCGKEFRYGDYMSHGNTYCSNECRHKALYIKVACDQCGKLHDRLASGVIWRNNYPPYRGHHFCSKKCSGKYAGLHYGFTENPQNISPRINKQKIISS